MPFDPKLIQPEAPPLDAAGELQLPDDLQELAAQLGDDAKYLAKVYPAHSGHLAPRDESIVTNGLTTNGLTTREDAFPLAEREGHNAAPPAAFHPHIRRTSRRLLRAVALVASLAAFAAGATLWYPRGENDPQPRNLAATPDRTTEVTHTVSTPTANNVESASPNPQSAISNQQSPPPAAPPPASRDTFLHEYSGPELEGIYDLIGDSEDDKISM